MYVHACARARTYVCTYVCTYIHIHTCIRIRNRSCHRCMNTILHVALGRRTPAPPSGRGPPGTPKWDPKFQDPPGTPKYRRAFENRQRLNPKTQHTFDKQFFVKQTARAWRVSRWQKMSLRMLGERKANIKGRAQNSMQKGFARPTLQARPRAQIPPSLR